MDVQLAGKKAKRDERGPNLLPEYVGATAAQLIKKSKGPKGSREGAGGRASTPGPPGYEAGMNGAPPVQAPAGCIAPVTVWSRIPITNDAIQAHDYRMTFSEWKHDWWNGYRNRSGGQEINAIILESLIYYMLNIPLLSANRAIIGPIIDNFAARREDIAWVGDQVNTCMSMLYGCARCIVSSQIEDRTIQALENGGHPWLTPQSPNARITYRQIIDLGAGLHAHMMGMRSKYYTITIDPGNMKFEELGANRARILSAVRMFISGQPGNDVLLMSKMDAAGKYWTKLSKDDPNSQMVHTTGVAADSASTTLIKMGRENLYVAPDDSSLELLNKMARNTYKIRLVPNHTFGALNPFGFTYDIKTMGTAEEWVTRSSSAFGKGATQGPSLDYLMELYLHAYSDPRGERFTQFKQIVPHNCLNISKDIDAAFYRKICSDIANNIPVFPAAKQDGDGRQVSEMGPVYDMLFDQGICGFLLFISQDRQAIIQAIIEIFKHENANKQLAVIQHHPDGSFTITRNDAGMSAEALAAYRAAADINYIKDNLALLVTIATTLSTNITAFIGGLGAAMPNIRSPVIQQLYRNKLEDIRTYMLRIVTILTTSNIVADIELGNLAAQAGALAAQIRAADANATARIAIAIKALYDKFEQQNITVSSLTAIRSLTVQFDPNRAYPFLKYAPADFVELDKLYRLESTALSGRVSRVPIDPLDSLYKKNGYFEYINDIIASFLNSTVADGLKMVFMFTPDDEMKRAQQVIATYSMSEKAYREILDTGAVARAPRPDEALAAAAYLRAQLTAYFARINVAASARGGAYKQSGGAYKQSGGALDPQDFEMLEEIAVDAAVFINSYLVSISTKPGIIAGFQGARGDDVRALLNIDSAFEDELRRTDQTLISSIYSNRAFVAAINAIDQDLINGVLATDPAIMGAIFASDPAAVAANPEFVAHLAGLAPDSRSALLSLILTPAFANKQSFVVRLCRTDPAVVDAILLRININHIVNYERDDLNNYTINLTPGESEIPTKKTLLDLTILSIPRTEATLKAADLLTRFDSFIDDVRGKLSELDASVISMMRDLLDPFESVPTPSPGAAGGAPPTITLRIKGTHPVCKIPTIVANVNHPIVSDQIEIWGLMVFAYLGELITNRINADNKSLFGAILGYPPLAVGDITMQRLWGNMIMAPSRPRQPPSRFVPETGASVTGYRGGVTAHPPILQTNGGLLYNILIAVIQRKFSSEAAGITFSGGRSTRRKRRHGKKGRKTRRA